MARSLTEQLSQQQQAVADLDAANKAKETQLLATRAENARLAHELTAARVLLEAEQLRSSAPLESVKQQLAEVRASLEESERKLADLGKSSSSKVTYEQKRRFKLEEKLATLQEVYKQGFRDGCES